MANRKMILPGEVEAVKLYLGSELCKGTPGAIVEAEARPDLRCWFRIIRNGQLLHRLMIWANVFEDLRGRETLPAFLGRMGVPAKMLAAQDKYVFVRNVRDEPDIEEGDEPDIEDEMPQ